MSKQRTTSPDVPSWEADLDGKKVVFGIGRIDRLGELANELGGQRILLVSDPGVVKAGHLERALVILEDAGHKVWVHDSVHENPRSSDAEATAETGRKGAIDLIVALGGGSVMDCAKGANFLLSNGGRMEDYWGYGKASQAMLPSIGVPTTAGTGSEAQSYALITGDESHRKMACGDRKARFRSVILDPALTTTQPPRVTALSGLDAVAHVFESYVTQVRSPISQMYAREAWLHLDRSFLRVLEAPEDLQARGEMLMGAHLAGLSIEHSMLGAAHACSNPLTTRFGLPHGSAVALMLPAVMRFNEEAVGSLYRELENVGSGCDASLSDRFCEFRKSASVPSGLRDCDIGRESLESLAEEAAREWTARFNPRKVSAAELLGIFEEAF